MTNTAPAIPTDQWEQDVPIGGVDPDTGHDAAHGAPVAVVVSGISLVRDAPAREATSNKFAVLQGADPIRIGRAPQRSRLLVRYTSTTAAATCVMADTVYGAQQGTGLVLIANEAPITILATDDRWIGLFTADGAISFLQEMHQG